MSFETLIWVRTQKTGSATTRTVLRVLADHAGQDHSCYLRTRLIASETELAESTVREALAKLVAAGLIRVYERYHDNGARKSNRYQILIDGEATEPPEHEDWADVRQREPEGEAPTGGGGGPAAGGGTQRELEVFPYTEASSSEASLVNGRAPRRDRATRLPDDFHPSPEMRAWFAVEKLHEVIPNPRAEHETFCDYWRAKGGADARKLDWPATWRNWMRRAGANATRNGSYSTGAAAAYRPSTTDAKVQQTLNLSEKYRLMEENQ